MNRFWNAVGFRRRLSSEAEGKKVVEKKSFQGESNETISIVGKENSSKTGVPEILSYFPELYVESSNGFSTKGVGQMICGTISSYFEDTWNKVVGETKQIKSRNISNSPSDLSFGVHLKREWHRIWFVRSFLAFTWESYLEDLIVANDQFCKEYLSLPSYGTNLEEIGKIPLGEILCIVSSSKLAFSEKSLTSIPFSTIQGKMVIKKSLSFNINIRWKTPPPNTVAKFRIFQDQKKFSKSSNGNLEQGDSIYLSLDIDNPQLIWKTSFPNQTAKEFEDLQLLASSIRVLRKEETAKYTIDGKKSVVIKLLNWYRETQELIKYESNYVNCKYFIEQDQFQFDNGLVDSKAQRNKSTVEYYITSDDHRKRKLSSGTTYISNGNYYSPLLEAVMRKSSKAVIYITKELISFELAILRKYSENTKFANSLGSILTGMDSGRKYYLHVEITSMEKEQQELQKKEKDKTLMFKHIMQNKRQFESRIQILQDLKVFGHLVISKFPLKNGESVTVENIFIKEIGNDSILMELLRVKFDQQLLVNNLFEFPFVVFEMEDYSKKMSQTFIVSPCVRNYNELLFYSHFRWLNEEFSNKKRFEISPNEAYSRRIFGDLRPNIQQNSQRNGQLQMGMSHYSKGISLLEELGGLNFYLKEGILEDLRDNRSIYSLELEFEWLKNNSSEGGLSLFFHIIRTAFFVLNESYGGEASDLDQIFLDKLSLVNVQNWSSNLKFKRTMEFLILETKKRAGSIYFSIIGLVTQLLMEIHLEGKTDKGLVEDLLNKIRESMRHASIQIILLDYLVTWILINVSIFKVCTSDLPLKVGSNFQNLLVYHRICRQFLHCGKEQIQVQLEALCGRITFTGIINSILPINTSNMKEGKEGREAFFQYLMRFFIFEKMSQLLVNPIEAETHQNNEKLSCFNLLRNEPVLDILSLGSNKNGILGLGLPRVQLFSDLECNLYPELSVINGNCLLDGVEEEKTKSLQKVVVPDESFLVKGITSISYGIDHIVILGKEGNILTWGNNSSGQCCIERKPNSKVSSFDFKVDKGLIKRIESFENMVFYPSQISCFSNVYGKITISKIDCGSFFTLALDSNGYLFSWGQGKDGCLGTGRYENSSLPQKVKLSKRVKSFSAGMFHCAAIDESDQLFVWGSNEFGQLGTKLFVDEKTLNTPFNISLKLSRENEKSSRITLTAVLDKDTENDTENIVKWKGVSLGEAHSIALDTEGIVWVWGQNNLKQLTGIPEILDIEIILSNGRISPDYHKKLSSQVIFPTPLLSTEKDVVFASRKINMVFSGGTACCAIDEQGKPWIWGLSFSGIDHHNSTSIFSRKNTSGAIDHTSLREFEFPVRVFRNITPDNDSIRAVRFGKGNNNISMISRLGRCYLWLENKELVTDEMKYSNSHNCFILEDLQSANFRESQSKNTRYHSILDVALLSDSMIFITKKINRNQNK